MKLQKCSLFGAVAGALMLTALFAPKVSALPQKPIVYFNFETGTLTSVPAPGPGGAYPSLQTTTITQDAVFPFPAGQFLVSPGVGTTTNQLAGDAPTTNSALNLSGNTSAHGSTGMYCFNFGVNTSGATLGASLSYALQSIGNTGQFTTLTTAYATVANPTQANFTTIATHSDLQTHPTYFTYTDVLPSGALNQANLTIEFCLSGSKNNANGNNTFIDNIQVSAAVPEPSTYIGGLLGIAILCWPQRRWLMRFLRLRRA